MSKERNYNVPKNGSEVYVDKIQHVCFDSEELPEILSWRVGDKYKIELLVEQVSERRDSEQDMTIAEFKIIDVVSKRGDIPKHLKNLVGGRKKIGI